MDLYEAIRCRRSVRSFRPDPIPQEVLDRVLEAARCAPSSLNLQPWRFILVKAPQIKREIVSCCPGQSFVEDAPLLIVACGLPTEGKIGGRTPSTLADVAVAMAHLSLAAAAEGLGTCWITAFEEEPLRRALGVPEGEQVVLISPLGYPTDKTTRAKHRKPMSEIICWERHSS